MKRAFSTSLRTIGRFKLGIAAAAALITATKSVLVRRIAIASVGLLVAIGGISAATEITAASANAFVSAALGRPMFRLLNVAQEEQPTAAEERNARLTAPGRSAEQAAALASVFTYNGSITASSPTFNRVVTFCSSTTPARYQAYTFIPTVPPSAGNQTVSATITASSGFTPTLHIYQPQFDNAQPCANWGGSGGNSVSGLANHGNAVTIVVGTTGPSDTGTFTLSVSTGDTMTEMNVETGSVATVGSTTATLNGVVTSNPGRNVSLVMYITSNGSTPDAFNNIHPPPSLSPPSRFVTAANSGGTNTFGVNVATALAPNTTYKYRAALFDNDGTGTLIYGGIVGTFTTTAVAAPDLTVAKAAQGSSFQQGGTVTYDVTVTNSGAGATTGTITMQDIIPTGLTVTSATGTNWTCTTGATVSCTRTTALAAGANSVITLNANIAANAPTSITNTASVSGGGESNTGNNSGSSTISVTAVAPDLTISKVAQGGPFQQGGTVTYDVTVTNGGNGPTTGTITMLDVIPTGLTVTSATGANWSCPLGATITCTRTTPLAAGANSVITLNANIAANAPASITNTATITTPGESNTGNNSGSSVISVTAIAPDLTVSKAAQGSSFQQGGTVSYGITVTNGGNGPTTGTITMQDVIPTGLTVTSATGANWSCTTGATVACTRTTALAAGANSVITLAANIALNAPASITNTATIATPGESNTGNNTGSSVINVSAASPVTINVPAGVSFTFNGQSYTGSQTILVPNGTYTLLTTPLQSIGAGSQALFTSWSDAGAISHSITVASAVTITGNFTIQHQLTTAANPPAGGTITPASGGFSDSGTVVNVSATANPQFYFTGWTGPVASASSSATTITMNAPATITANFYPCTNTVVVANLNDNGAGSLRQAVIDVCPGGTITFAPAVTGTIVLTSGQMVIAKNLTITGPGASLLGVSGNNAGRIFSIPTGTVAISGLTFSGGNLPVPEDASNGGAILNQDGNLTVSHSVFTGNFARNHGGAIYNFAGPLTVISSRFSGNSASDGGAIASTFGTLTVDSSSFSGNEGFISGGGAISQLEGTSTFTNSVLNSNNSSDGGGAIAIYSGASTIKNTTVSNNSTDIGNGGGIENRGTLSLINSTVTGNVTTGISAGGIVNFGTLAFRNTIIAGNLANQGEPDIVGIIGTMTSLGNNLIGKSNGFTNGVNGDIVGTVAAPVDPLLGPLANNGGPTLTHALLPDSLAINAGNDCVLDSSCPTFNAPDDLTTDQRGDGFPRKIGSAVDVGAYEVQNTAPTANPDSYSTDEDTPLTIPAPGVLANDTDDENNVLSVASFTQPAPAAGGVAVNADGSFTFTPAANYNGPASFTYRVSDGSLLSAPATVSITVNAVNDAPSINSTPPTNATEDLLYTYNATFTDVDGPGSAWSILPANTCTGASISSTGVYTFTPAGPVPPVSCVISIQVCDTGTPNACGTQTTTIQIAAVNDAPSITAASGISRVQGTSSSSQIASVSDPDNAANTLAVTVNNAASATVNGVTVSGISVNAAGQVTATVSAACGSTNASFTLRVTDPGPGSQTAMATLSITVVNETVPPVINPITNVVAFLPPNSSATSMPVSFPLPTATDNCSTPVVTTNPVSGSVFNVGTTVVNVTATDANGNFATATFTVTVRYNFSGFTGRTLSPPAVNYASAGNVIPVSFNLSGDKGLNIFAAGSPSSQQVNCISGTPIGASSPASLPLGLQYFGGQYQFYWQTTNVWAGTCRVLSVAFNDGSTFTANFTFYNNGATLEMKGGEKKTRQVVRPEDLEN